MLSVYGLRVDYRLNLLCANIKLINQILKHAYMVFQIYSLMVIKYVYFIDYFKICFILYFIVTILKLFLSMLFSKLLSFFK